MTAAERHTRGRQLMLPTYRVARVIGETLSGCCAVAAIVIAIGAQGRWFSIAMCFYNALVCARIAQRARVLEESTTS